MLDRDKLETLLSRRFAGASSEQVASAANAIMGLEDEWEEVAGDEHDLGPHFSVRCSDICSLASDLAQGAEFRLFRRRGA